MKHKMYFYVFVIFAAFCIGIFQGIVGPDTKGRVNYNTSGLNNTQFLGCQAQPGRYCGGGRDLCNTSHIYTDNKLRNPKSGLSACIGSGCVRENDDSVSNTCTKQGG